MKLTITEWDIKLLSPKNKKKVPSNLKSNFAKKPGSSIQKNVRFLTYFSLINHIWLKETSREKNLIGKRENQAPESNSIGH